MMGMKQNLVRVLAFKAPGMAMYLVVGTHVNHSHRLYTRAEKLPQFWHWAVTFSYPERRDENAVVQGQPAIRCRRVV